MDEIVPGLYHWTAYHDGIGQDVHSHFAAESRTLFDPMEPPDGLGWFERNGAPERIVLSNRHHYRHSDRFREAFGCPVLCHEAGLHEFPDGHVEGFEWGDDLAPGVTALEVGVLCPEETAVKLAAGDGALLLADSLIRGPHGDLGFVPDGLLGDDPQAIREGLRGSLRRLLDEHEWDALLLAHGAPIPTGARSALRTFVDAPSAGAPPG
jgi:hypothetical protein